ncbi:MAG: 3-hydroxyacyl-CoA dehydrogenase [Candidatus Acidiferrales bacterium]
MYSPATMSAYKRFPIRLGFFAILFAVGALLAIAGGPTTQSRHGRLFFLTIGGRGTGGGRVSSVNDDGTDLKVLVSGQTAGPDGIAVDTTTKKIYWTNMGRPSANDGTIESSNFDGSDVKTVVPAGGAWTPKQLKLDSKHGKLYWSDREGMRIMRANLDGSEIETLVETAEGDAARKDARNWCVGIALDVDGGKVYWTQKGSGGNGRIFRANLNIPKGEDAAHRTDIETLFDSLPEPIDMDLDLANRMLYWSDRGDPPAGNNISRAPMDAKRAEQQILVGGLKEGIGMALDLKDKRMFYTDLGGNVYAANMDGTDAKVLLSGQGALTGITWVDLGN